MRIFAFCVAIAIGAAGLPVAAETSVNERNWVAPETLLRKWTLPSDGSEIRIEAADPQNPERADGLRLHTRRFVYTGTYRSGETPRPARLTFRYTPKAAEMNRDVPLAARQQVEGKLHWEFELDEVDDCLCSGLKFKWYPGEITWNEANPREASVSGRGTPTEDTYAPVPPDPTEQVKAPVLLVQSSDANVSGYEPQQTIAFKSPFRLQVLLPEELARKQGSELKVEIKADKTWSSTSATLTGRRLESGVWSYVTDPPVTLVPVPTTGDTSWFRADEGELVHFTYTAPDGTTASDVASIYQNNVYQAIARNDETLTYFQNLYEALLQPNARFDGRPIAARERAVLEQKLRLIRNARTILGNDLPELVSVAVGDAYVHLLQDGPYEEDTRWSPDRSYNVPGRYVQGVQWVAVPEMQNVYAAMRDARDKYHDIFVNLVRDYGVDSFYGLFLGGIDQAMIVFGGTDLQGRSYDTAHRVLAGIEGVTTIALVGILGSAARQAQAAKVPRAAAERAAARDLRNLRENTIRAAARAEAERVNTGLGPAGAQRMGTPVRGGFMRHARTGEAFHENLDGMPASARFDPAADNLNPDPLFQCRGNTCALMSTVHAARSKGRSVVTSERLLTRLVERYGLIDNAGIKATLMPKIARLLGIDYEFRNVMYIDDVRQALARGEKVVGGIYWLDEKGARTTAGHAIHILEVLPGRSPGAASYVKFWDPSSGRRVGMLGCDFAKMYDPRHVLVIK